MRPALRALARDPRDDASRFPATGSGCKMDPALGFDVFVKQIDDVLDAAGVERAAICGVSYGGLIAVRYAALRPERVSRADPDVDAGPRVAAEPRDRLATSRSRGCRCRPSAAPRSIAWAAKSGPRFRTGGRGSDSRSHMSARRDGALLPGLMARRVQLQQQTPTPTRLPAHHRSHTGRDRRRMPRPRRPGGIRRSISELIRGRAVTRFSIARVISGC